jgi:hypothetical protein
MFPQVHPGDQETQVLWSIHKHTMLSVISSLFSVTGSCYIAQAGLEFTILLPQPPEWVYRCVPPYLAVIIFPHILVHRLCEIFSQILVHSQLGKALVPMQTSTEQDFRAASSMCQFPDLLKQFFLLTFIPSLSRLHPSIFTCTAPLKANKKKRMDILLTAFSVTIWTCCYKYNHSSWNLNPL